MQDELRWFEAAAASPSACLKQWQAQGGQAVGCLPYYVPEELIWSAGLLPVRLWGASTTARLDLSSTCKVSPGSLICSR